MQCSKDGTVHTVCVALWNQQAKGLHLLPVDEREVRVQRLVMILLASKRQEKDMQ